MQATIDDTMDKIELKEIIMSLNETIMGLNDKISYVIHVAERFGMTDGKDHKEWLVDQMVRILLAEKYDTWVKHFNNQPCCITHGVVWQTGSYLGK